VGDWWGFKMEAYDAINEKSRCVHNAAPARSSIPMIRTASSA
jgi:hypothetical protein